MKVFLRKIARFEVASSAVLILAHLAAALSPAGALLKWFTNDDAFFYFTVARNIGSGYGITFDRISLTNGFHPLWMAVCVPVFLLARLDPFLPLRLLIVLLGILQAVTGILLYRLAAQVMSRPIAVLVGILWTFAPFVHRVTAQGGLEAGVTAFFLVVSLYLIHGTPSTASPGRIALVGLAGALLFLSRLDTIFLVAMLGFWLVFRSQPLRYYLSLDVLAVLFSTLLSIFLLTGLGPIYSRGAFVMMVVALILKLPVFLWLGLYHPPRSLPLARRLIRVLAGVTISTAGLAAILLILLKLKVITAFPRTALALDWALSLVLIAGIRILADWLADKRSRGPLSVGQTLRQQGPGWLRDGMIYFGIVGSVVLLYMGWNALQFGTPTPVSGQIKEWWGVLGATVYGKPVQEVLPFFGLDPQASQGPWGPALSFLFAAIPSGSKGWVLALGMVYLFTGAVLLRIRETRALQMADQLSLLPVLAGCFIQIWTYNARSYVQVRNWYWVAELVFTVLALGILLDSLIQLVPWPRFQLPARFAVVLLLGAIVLGNFGGMLTQQLRVPESGSENADMLKEAQFLESATPPGSLIGMTGGGSSSYFVHDRTIVNLDGLINSYPYFQSLQQFQAAGYLAGIGLDYIYGNPMVLTETMPYQKEFSGSLEPLQDYSGWVLYAFANKGKP